MGELVNQLPQLSALIEKGGVVGLMLIVIGVLVREVWRLREELTKQYGLRDKYRLGFALCKKACDDAGLKVDLSMIADLLKESGDTI